MRFKAPTFNPKKHCLPIFAQGKLDGHRLKVCGRPDETVALTTQGIDISAKLEQYDWWKKLVDVIEPGVEIEGELCVPNKPAEKVKSALKHGDYTFFSPFATNALPYNADLEDMSEYFNNLGLDFPYWVDVPEPESNTINGVRALLNHLLRQFKEVGFTEGLVLKDGNYENWYKVKNERTIDVIVADFRPGRKRLVGLVGSLVLKTVEGKHVCNCNGMDDFTRISIDEKRDRGRVVEVRYDRIGTGGKLRFPRFVRWRDDKTADECTLDQDPDLEEFWSTHDASTVTEEE